MLVAKSSIAHNGKDFLKGDVIEGVTDAEMKQLVDTGSAEIVADPAPVLSQSEQKRVVAQNDAKQADADKKAHNAEVKAKAKELGLKYVGVSIESIEKSIAEFEAKNPETKKVISSKPSLEWGKIKLIGEARRRGIVADETMTPEELLAQIEVTPEPPADDDNPDTVPALTKTSVKTVDVPEADE